VIELTSGPALASIDPARGFMCTRFVLGDWPVLGDGGMRIEFPRVGTQAARPSRLRLGATDVDIGGGPAGGLAASGWTLDAQARARLRTNPTDSAYAFEVEVLATWCLDAEGLHLELQVRNLSKRHAPFGVGVRADLAPFGTRVLALAPAEQYSAAVDLRRPVAVEQPIAVSLTRRHFANLQTQLAVLRGDHTREVWLNTSADFREAQFSVNPDGSAILAAATCVPDAFALQAEGLTTGLRVLAPGETWRGRALLVAARRAD
jgi:galactose mutarotase-like enzyme